MNSPIYRAILLTVLAAASTLRAADDYKLGPDSEYHEGVPKGKITKHTFDKSKLFPGSTREYQVYVPAQYKAEEPACVMIFQDGGGFANDKGGYRVPVVFDNLIHKKEMPVTIAIMINPGIIQPPKDSKAHPRFNRSFEYDSANDLYARFLIDEILPEVAKEYNLTKDATGRALCGASSGGIAAFAAAWERPDSFSRVVSFIGSFTNLRGGHDYANLIRKTEPKPLRIYMQDGSADLDIYSGSWWIGNLDVAAALKFAGYEFEFAKGDGGHNGKHGGAILPDALRYIWKDYPALPKPGTMSGVDKRNIMGILIPGEGWQVVSEGHKSTEGPAADAEGNVYHSADGKIFKISPDGKSSLFAETDCGADGMMVGPNNKLYVCANKTLQLVTFDLKDKTKTVIASEFPSVNDVVVTTKGAAYMSDHKSKQVWYVSPTGEKKVVDTGITFPNGLILTPDQTQLIVADMQGAGLYIFTIKDDGSLANKQLYFYCQLPAGKSTCGADGLAMDANGMLYVCTNMGIQVFDQAGRVNGIIPSPVPNRKPSNIEIGGPDRAYLYISVGDKIYRRKTKAKGVLFFEEPVLPPKPQL